MDELVLCPLRPGSSSSCARQTTHVLTVVEALADCGLANFEVSLTTPGAMSLIAQLCSSMPHLAIGAGTVMNADQAEAAIV